MPVGTATPFNYGYTSEACPDPEYPIYTDITVKIEGSAAQFMSPTSWTWAEVVCGGDSRSQQVIFKAPCGVPDGTYQWIAYAYSSNPDMPMGSTVQGSGSFSVFTPALSVQLATDRKQYAPGEPVSFAVQVKSSLDGSGVAASITIALDGVVIGTLNSGSNGYGSASIGTFRADQSGPHYLTATAAAGACYRSGSSNTAAFSITAPATVMVTETLTETVTVTELTTETTTETFVTVTEMSSTQTETTTRVVTETTTERQTAILIDIETTTTTETADDDC